MTGKCVFINFHPFNIILYFLLSGRAEDNFSHHKVREFVVWIYPYRCGLMKKESHEQALMKPQDVKEAALNRSIMTIQDDDTTYATTGTR